MTNRFLALLAPVGNGVATKAALRPASLMTSFAARGLVNLVPALTLSRYFSPNLAQELASDRDAIDLGGQRR